MKSLNYYLINVMTICKKRQLNCLCCLFFLIFYDNISYSQCIKNPVIFDYKIHDVSLIKGDDSIYYAFSTCNVARDSTIKIVYYGINIFRSVDLVNWKFWKRCTENVDSQSENETIRYLDDGRVRLKEHNGSYAVWSPEVLQINGKILLFVSFRKNFDDSCIALYEADSISSPFKYKTIVVSNNIQDRNYFNTREIIDPFPINVNGRLFLFFGSFARDKNGKFLNHRKRIGVYIVELDLNDYSMKSKPIFITDYYEGISVINLNDGFFLFGTNGNWTDNTYSISYAYSKNITGPYLNSKGLSISDTVKFNRGDIILQTNAYHKYGGFGCMSSPIIDKNGNYYVLANGHDKSIEPIVEKSSDKERYIFLLQLCWDSNSKPRFILDNIINDKQMIPDL